MHKKSRKKLFMFLFGFGLGILCICSGLFGAWYSCEQSGGVLLSDMTCSNLVDMGVCEYEGRVYTFDSNFSVGEMRAGNLGFG